MKDIFVDKMSEKLFQILYVSLTGAMCLFFLIKMIVSFTLSGYSVILVVNVFEKLIWLALLAIFILHVIKTAQNAEQKVFGHLMLLIMGGYLLISYVYSVSRVAGAWFRIMQVFMFLATGAALAFSIIGLLKGGLANLKLNAGMKAGAQAPTYGQQAPTYGQQAPTYGAQAPTYGQQAPTYGQQAPTYGQQAATYGQQAATYGQQAATYGQQAATYGQQAPTYEQQAPAYADPAVTYDSQNETLPESEGVNAVNDDVRIPTAEENPEDRN